MSPSVIGHLKFQKDGPFLDLIVQMERYSLVEDLKQELETVRVMNCRLL